MTGKEATRRAKRAVESCAYAKYTAQREDIIEAVIIQAWNEAIEAAAEVCSRWPSEHERAAQAGMPLSQAATCVSSIRHLHTEVPDH